MAGITSYLSTSYSYILSAHMNTAGKILTIPKLSLEASEGTPDFMRAGSGSAFSQVSKRQRELQTCKTEA
jgi:hypothetical protein